MIQGNELSQAMFWSCWKRWVDTRGGPFFWMRRWRSRRERQETSVLPASIVSPPSSHQAIVILGLAAVAGVGVVDYITKPEVNMFLLYLLLIALVGWFRGETWGLVTAVTCSAAWIAGEWKHGFPAHHPAIIVWDVLVNPGFFVVFNFTLWVFRRKVEGELVSARQDFLTGLPNRRGFHERSRVELERARRSHQPLTVAYLDLDRFKDVNDTFGHATGDHALRRVAQTLKSDLRVTDISARLGGDEFVVLLPNTSVNDAQMILKKLRERLLSVMRRHQWPITFSVGVVTFLRLPRSIEEMLHLADRSMYLVKENQKDAIRHEVESSTDSHAVVHGV